jgi:hypothetical protein
MKYTVKYKQVWLDSQGIVQSEMRENLVYTNQTLDQLTANFKAADGLVTSFPLQETISVTVN